MENKKIGGGGGGGGGGDVVEVEGLAGSGFRRYLLFLRLLTHSHPHLIFATHVCFLTGTSTICFKSFGREYSS